jgi:hypothetical protein
MILEHIISADISAERIVDIFGNIVFISFRRPNPANPVATTMVGITASQEVIVNVLEIQLIKIVGEIGALKCTK